MGFPCGSAGKESACNAGDLGSIPGLGRSPGEGKGYLLQYSGLENSMDCIVHGVSKSQTQLSNFHFHCATISNRNSKIYAFKNKCLKMKTSNVMPYKYRCQYTWLWFLSKVQPICALEKRTKVNETHPLL